MKQFKRKSINSLWHISQPHTHYMFDGSDCNFLLIALRYIDKFVINDQMYIGNRATMDVALAYGECHLNGAMNLNSVETSFCHERAGP